MTFFDKPGSGMVMGVLIRPANWPGPMVMLLLVSLWFTAMPKPSSGAHSMDKGMFTANSKPLMCPPLPLVGRFKKPTVPPAGMVALAGKTPAKSYRPGRLRT